MSEYLIQKETLDNIARQTRSLVGQTSKMFPSTMIKNLTYVNEEAAVQNCLLAECLNLTYDQNPGALLDTLMARNLIILSIDDVTTIGDNAFCSCSSLTSVSFPQATTIGNYAFSSCSSLTSVSFPKATTIGNYAFCSCSSLISVSFPQATSIGDNAFYSCSSLTSVSFPQATTIGTYAFTYCSSLTSVSFPQATTIGNYAFYKCSSLTSIYLGASQVCTLGNSNAFSNTGIWSNKGSIFVPTSLVTAYQSATNWVYFSSRIFALEDNAMANGG